VLCVKCHPAVKNKEITYVLYKTDKTKCEDCHQ
jgi:hypothetical protein